MSEFKIQASKKAFQILSSKIYSNPILAIIRELSTNAWDAHLEAGHTDVPFNVTLPTHDNNYEFAVRDFGTGLSYKDVRGLYTTYFASTKELSDESIGSMGLGSKSPIAYVDEFLVTSFYEGVAYFFRVFKNLDGVPEIEDIGSKDTDELNGLKISLYAKSSDSYEFVECAESIYAFFDVHPQVLNAKSAGYSEKIISKPFQGKNWFVSPDLKRGSYVLMGQVLYNSNLPEGNEQINGACGLVVVVPPNSVEPQPSREALSYNEQTKRFIIHSIEAAIKEFRDAAFLQRIEEDGNFFRYLKYREFNSIIELDTHKAGQNNTFAKHRWVYLKRNGLSMSIRDQYRYDYAHYIKTCAYYVEDEGWGVKTKRKLRYDLESRGLKDGMIFENEDDAKLHIGNRYKKISDLETPPRKEAARKAAAKYVKILNGYRRLSAPSDGFEVNEDYLIVPSRRDKVIINGMEWGVDKGVFGSLLKVAGVDKGQVYAVSNSHYAKFKRHYGNAGLEDTARIKLKEWLANASDIDIYAGTGNQVKKSTVQLAAQHNCNESKYIVSLAKADPKSKHMKLIAGIFKVSFPEPKQDYIRNFFQKFPMLEQTYQACESDCLEYMRLVEDSINKRHSR